MRLPPPARTRVRALGVFGGRVTTRTALAAALVTSAAPMASAQTVRQLTACTPDALSVCTELRLTSQPSLFEIGIRTIGATGAATLPVSVYNLVFGTGAASVGSPVNLSVTPLGDGGASVTDASPWDLFDTGDLLFLSALSNRGVGGCVTGPDEDGFGQAAVTCGADAFVTFRFAPTAAFDPRRFQLLDLEAVALVNPTQGVSCGAPEVACVITRDVVTTATPEPAPVVLVSGGLLVVGVAARRRRV